MADKNANNSDSLYSSASGGDQAVEALLSALRELWRVRNLKVAEQWHRYLPFADYVVDRWQRATALGFGEGASIYDSSLVLGDVKVGRNTWIGPFTILDGSACLEIGDYCSISAGVQIYTHDTVAWSTSGGMARADCEPVRIGNRCYIGPNSIISKGVTIGDGTVVGAQSLVNRDLPGGVKAWGTPARVIREI